jgi:hypothetical protein
MDAYRSTPGRLEPAPRDVPRPLVWRLRLAGVMAQLGCLAVLLGSLAAWIIAPYIAWPVSGPFVYVPGETDTWIDTDVRINGRRLQKVLFHYEVEGKDFHAFSYTTRSTVEGAVRVQVPEDAPAEGCIVGMDRSPVPLWVGFLLAGFPLVGLGLVAWAWRRGNRQLRLLAHGVATRGRLIDRRPTPVQINGKRVHVLTFEFTGELDRVFRAEVRTHLVEKLEDDAEEALVYDPQDPRRATTLDHLPGAPAIDAQGRLQLRDPGRPWHWLAPLAVVLVNVVAAAIVVP